MRLEPLYRLTFHYPESWFVEVESELGVESEQLLIAEGRAEGRIAGVCAARTIRGGALT